MLSSLCPVMCCLTTEEGDQINVRAVGKESAAPARRGGITPWSQILAAFANGSAAGSGMATVNKGTKFNSIFEAVM